MNATQARNRARADIEPEVLAARARDFGFRLADRDELQAAISMAENAANASVSRCDFGDERSNRYDGMGDGRSG